MRRIPMIALLLVSWADGRAQVAPFNYTISTVAGNGVQGFSGDGGLATMAELQWPPRVAIDGAGNLLIADPYNGRIRKVTPGGIITTVAGNGTAGFAGDGGPATMAELSQPCAFISIQCDLGITVDGAGNLFIADGANNRIRKVTPGGVITTVAGNGMPGFAGDGGPATMAELSGPLGITVDGAGNLFIADTFNYRIRKVTPGGVITTMAGDGTQSFSGDGGPATMAEFDRPMSIAVDGGGNLFIADTFNDRIRKVTADGLITTVAGNGQAVWSGDGGLATIAPLWFPEDVAVDGSGNLFIADTGNNRIRMVTPGGTIFTVVGSLNQGFSGDGGPSTSASLASPEGVIVDPSGNIIIADAANMRIRKATPVIPAVTSVANAAGEETVVAQNTWIEIKGSNLASDTRTWESSDFVNNQLPTKLDGISVVVNGKSAYVYYISPTQVNVLTPLDSAQGSVMLQVTNNGSTTTAFGMQLQAYAPGLFQFGGSAYAAATHANGSLLGPASLYPGSSTPANPGETIVLYGTGFGPTSPPIVSGWATQTGSLPVLPTVKICGVSASVQFAGLSGAGLYQLNVIVPGSVSGDCTTTVTYNGVTSNSALVSVTGSASNGSLQIQITGLPNGTSGNISVTGPAGFSQAATSNQTLQVAPGTYIVTANSVPVGSVYYAAFPVQQSVNVTSGSTTSVSISYSIVVPNTTMVLDQQGNQGLTVSNNGATVTLPATSQTAQALEPGSVLAIGSTASTPNGLLGKVVSVTQSSSQVIVQTTQASLIDAFQQVDFTFSTTLTPQNTPTLTAVRPGVSLRWASAKAAAPRDSTPPSCTSDSSLIAEMIDVPIVKDSNGSLTLTGEIDLCPSLEFDPNVQAFPPRLNSLKATMSFGETAHVNITGSYHGSFSAEVPIATAASEPITVWVGPVPIVLTPSLSIYVGVSGNASAGFSVGATQTASVTGGFSYANGQTTDLNNSTSSFTEDPVALDAGLSVKAYTGVKMELEVEGVLSPSFSPDAYIQLNVNPLSSPWWTLSAGLEGDANVKVSILGAQLADFDDPSLFNVSKVIAQASGGYTPGSAAPVLSTMTPTSANAGNQGLTITLTGTNFVPGATVAFGGTTLATTYVSPTQLTAVLPSGALAAAGTFQVTVTNPDQAATASNPLVFVVASVKTPNPVPAINTLSPSAAVAGASPITVLINGTGFVAGSTVTFHGIVHVATFLSASQLSISLTSADLANAGTYQVVVTNSAPGGGSSQPATFTVQSAPVTPTLQSLTLSASTVIGGGSVTGTITLTAAAPTGGLQVLVSSNNSAAQTPIFATVSGGQISATFTVMTVSVISGQAVIISASVGTVTKTANLAVNAAPVTATVIYAGTDSGVYRSGDGG
jgi:uncharacterized protein (TIGR03437 family)